MTREEFREKAKAITVSIGGREFQVDPREFRTDSVGWYLSAKLELVVDGERVKCHAGLTVTAIGSKQWE